jgi:serine protease Do
MRWALAVAAAAWLGAAGCDRPQRGAPEGAGSVSLPPGATPVPAVPSVAGGPTATAPLAVPATGADLHAAPVSFAPIAQRANPGVVTITTLEEQAEVSPFTGRVRRRESSGLGTGFVIDKSGIILTNNHVVGGADSIAVKLTDERELPGKVVATDPLTDVAVLRIDAKDLRPLPLGDSDALEVGDWVVAIGNPFGLSHTVSAGILSAKGRTENELDPSGYYNFLQTDASINPGNSGGPLLNLRGEVVGINSMIRGGGAQGIGFAIPINMVKQLLPMLLRDGHMTRSALGVQIVDARQLAKEERQALGLLEGAHPAGAVIGGVARGGPADKAGLKPGDVVVGFEGQPVDRSAQLRWLASTAGVGRAVTLRVRRSDKTFDVKVTLDRLPDPPSAGPR